MLGIAGGTIGIGWSSGTLAVAAWCGRRYGADSNQARAILGVGLALLCIACEYNDFLRNAITPN